MTTILPHGPESAPSPFDAIRRVDEHGENWDARDLMPLLTYDKWENFAEVIEKARVAIAAAGGDPDAHASRRQEASGRTRRGNYRLTRYGAYITAMVGDVRKTAVGQALTYFAVKTREAEVAPPAARELSRRELAQMVIEAEDRAELEAAARQRAETKVAELEPRAAAADALTEASGTLSIGAVAKMFAVGRTTFFRILYAEHILCRDRTPRQEYAAWFRVVATPRETSTGRVVIDHVAYLYPEGALRLHHLLTRRGYKLRAPEVGGQLALVAGGAS